jgi:hypothetical protein
LARLGVLTDAFLKISSQKLTSCLSIQSTALNKFSGGGAVAVLGGGALFKSCVFEQNEASGAQVRGTNKGLQLKADASVQILLNSFP